MSNFCAGFAGRFPLGLFLAVTGLILVGLGVLVFVEPRVLGWMIAVAAIAMGATALVGAVATRGWGRGRAGR